MLTSYICVAWHGCKSYISNGLKYDQSVIEKYISIFPWSFLVDFFSFFLYLLLDQGKAKGCSTNTIVICSLTKQLRYPLPHLPHGAAKPKQSEITQSVLKWTIFHRLRQFSIQKESNIAYLVQKLKQFCWMRPILPSGGVTLGRVWYQREYPVKFYCNIYIVNFSKTY